ncbi:MAG TPA: hypothetical protein VFU41_05615 [Gemmatimonadales bacterium]|nr:hypothetical protein [Gemmatimonadales bacterium]
MRPGRLARLGGIAATLGVASCVENLTAPGKCPEFCPSGSIRIVDTLLTMNVSRDSAYRGYVLAHEPAALAVVDAPGVMDSRAIMVTGALADAVVLAGDTVTDRIVGSDSLKLTLTLTRRDTGAQNLTLRFYRLPVNLDSTTTFANVAGAFATAPLRTVNLDSLEAKATRDTATGNFVFVDPATGDAIAVDTATDRVALTVKFDSLQAPYSAADSGRLGIGLRVAAGGPTSVAIATRASVVGGARVSWYATVDSITDSSTTRIHKLPPFPRGVEFESFVFDPPPAPLDSTLAVGGAPSARSLLRVDLPRAIRDSSQIVRATLILVPAVAARGAPADSFIVEAHTVLTDFGAKSPIALDPQRTDTAMIRIGATDSVRIEVTNLLRLWAVDTILPTAIMLRAQDEGSNPAEIRFYPSAAQPYRPSLRVTFARRFPFGVP